MEESTLTFFHLSNKRTRMSKIQELLQPFPIQVKLPVQWGEMDAFRHVNNTIYIRWAETGRLEYFRQMNLKMDEPEKEDFGVILGWQDCKYIFPVRFPDTVFVGTRVTELGEYHFYMECQIFSEKHDRIVAITKHKIIAFDYRLNQKILIPEILRDRIGAIEQKGEED